MIHIWRRRDRGPLRSVENLPALGEVVHEQVALRQLRRTTWGAECGSGVDLGLFSNFSI
jgi:hypothetical protein